MNKKLERLSLLVAVTLFVLCAFPDTSLAQTPLFSPQTEYGAASKNGPSGVAVGDFNGDGKLDLAVSNYGDNSLSVLLGNGDGTFQAPHTTPVGTNPAQVAVGDFNGDGKLDVAVSSVGSNTVSVLLGNGDGTFLPPLITPVGANPWYFAVGDFNGDGKLDLAVADYGCPLDCNSSPSNTVTVLLGLGNGTFQPAPSLTVGNGPAGVAVGDFNGDGRQDLAVANVNDNTLSVLLGNGDGTFQAPHTFADPGMTHPYFVAVSDFNRDGKQDLVVTNHLFATVSVLLGNGDGTFQAAQDFAVDNDPVDVTVSISDATSGATIYYTTDGSTPTSSSAVYTGALTFTQTTTLKAMAAASG